MADRKIVTHPGIMTPPDDINPEAWKVFAFALNEMVALKYPKTYTLTSGDATPSVAGGHVFITAGTTAITDFDDGILGQTIRIKAAADIVITHNAAIILKDGVNFNMISGDTLTLTMFADQVWTETGRSMAQTDFALEVPKGNISGTTSINKFGRSTNVDTTVRDIWDVVGTAIWVAPLAARTHAIVSSSASDASAGVGAQTVRIYGLTGWGAAEVNETVTLNGTTPVNTVNDYVIIHRMRVLTKGATDINVGDITATAATDSTVTAQINASEGQTQMAIYGIPSTQTAYVTKWYASVNKTGGSSANVDMTIAVNHDPDVELLNFVTKATLSILEAGSSHFQHNYTPYLKIAGPAIIKSQAVSSAVNADVSSGFDVYLVDN